MKNSRIAFFEGGTVAGPERTLPEQFLLIRFGRNLYTKNGERGEFEFTPEDADKVIDDFTARGRDLVIDYEHQSLSGEKRLRQAGSAVWKKLPRAFLHKSNTGPGKHRNSCFKGNTGIFRRPCIFRAAEKR